MYRVFVYTVNGDLSEIEPNHWVAHTKEWGLTTHGKTSLEADLRMSYAVSLMARHTADLEREFKRAGIEYRVYDHPDKFLNPPDTTAYTSSGRNIEASTRVTFKRSGAIGVTV